MKNKHYNIFFTSEKDGLGKSFRLSSITLWCIMSFFISIMILSYIGFNRMIGYDEITYELDQLRKYKYITSNLLIESGMVEEVVRSDDLERIIVDYIIANNILYPSNPPVDGYVTKGIVKRNNEIVHAGINIASKFKDEILSPLDGIVVLANQNQDLGNTIILHHQNNFFTIYGYLDTILVKTRDLISKNQVIGKVGKSDDSDPHLYFEVWKDNQVIDPRDLINDYKEKDVSIR